MTKYKIFPFSQFLYYFLTAVWPLIHIQSFMAITGEKRDIWLVKTVSVLLLPYCLLLLYLTFSYRRNFMIVISIILCCLGLLWIDLYYYFAGIIKWTYLLDGFFQLLFIIYWTVYMIRSDKK